MGEYEDRYPDAYGRVEDTAQATAVQDRPITQPARQSRERPLLERLGLRAGQPRAWHHRRADAPLAAEDLPAQAAEPPPAPEPTEGPTAPTMAPPRTVRTSAAAVAVAVATPAAARNFRGRGPRGYLRSAERIREDLCDRLTESPVVDASDIEVAVTGSEVVLTGSVDTTAEYQHVQEIALEVSGVTRVSNRLSVRTRGGAHPTAGDRVNATMPPRTVRT